MTNLDSILRNRNITLLTKVHLVKTMVFPVVMYGCESWTIKKAERRRIDAFELWCWRRFLRVPWTARRSNQSILKEINPGCSLEGLMLKLKLQNFGHLMRRPWCWERLKAGGEGDDRGWDGQMASLTRWTWVWVSSGSWWSTERPAMMQSMGSQRVGYDWATELNWTGSVSLQASKWGWGHGLGKVIATLFWKQANLKISNPCPKEPSSLSEFQASFILKGKRLYLVFSDNSRRNLIIFCFCSCPCAVQLLSRVWLFVTLWTATC